MSYRKAKLLLQQKKQLEQAATKPIHKQDQQQLEQTYVPAKKNANMFQAFSDDDDDDEQKQRQEQDRKKGEQVEEKKGDGKAKKKNKNKKKKKEKEETKDIGKQPEEVDVEKAFNEVGLEYKTPNKQQKQRQIEDWQEILSINENKFNYEKQLRRHFGNVGSLAEEKVEEPDLNKRQQRLQKHLKKAMKKSVLSPGVKDVFIIRQKFQVERKDQKICFLPTKKYDHYQAEYETIRNSNDINALFMFMQTHPEHVDSIYAVGQFLRLQGNYRDADSLIQRVIYIYEMAGSYDLGEFIREDLVKKEIVYDAYSTSLFMSLFKFMDILGKKGCYRSALEYNKFLLKINLNDPTASLLCMDFNAISAKCNEYLINFVRCYGRYLGNEKSSLYLLPNFTYSVALAKYYSNGSGSKDKEKSSKLLVQQNQNQELLEFKEEDWQAAIEIKSDHSFVDQNASCLILRALLIYPKLIIEIANKNQYGKQFLNYGTFVGNQKKSFKDILSHDFWSIVPTSYSYNFLKLENATDSAGLDKVMEVYVQRSKILWKSNEVMLWVKAAMGFLLNKIDAKEFDYQEYLQKLCTEESGGLPIPFNLRRYANISKHNFSDRVERINLADIQDNQNQQRQPQNANRMGLQGNALTMFLNSLLPWVNLPNGGNQDPDMPDIHQDD